MTAKRKYLIMILALILFQLIGQVYSQPLTFKTKESVLKSANWLLKNQEGNGEFKAPSARSVKENDPLILACASIVLLEAYKLSGEEVFLDGANKTLKLLRNWQNPDGSWSDRSVFLAGGTYYPIVSFAKYEIYTGKRSYRATLTKAVNYLINYAGERGEKQPYLFELAEYIYAVLLAWKATNNESYFKTAKKWISTLINGFNSRQGAWFTKKSVEGVGWGPQGMWDAALPALIATVYEDDNLTKCLNTSIEWAYKHLLGFEKGAYKPSFLEAPLILSGKELTDTVNVYPHFSAEFLILSSILSDKRANETVEWLLSMQAPTGGFFYFKKPTGEIENETYIWDTFWVVQGLSIYLNEKCRREAYVKLKEAEEMVKEAEKGTNVSQAEKYLIKALNAFKKMNYELSLNYSEAAIKEIEKSEEAYFLIKKAMLYLENTSAAGINTTTFREEIKKEKIKYDLGLFDETIKETNEIINQIREALDLKRNRTLKHLTEIKNLICNSTNQARNFTAAKKYLEEAYKFFKKGNYSEAEKYATKAEKSALQELKMKRNILNITILIPLIVIPLTVIALTRRKRGGKKKITLIETKPEYREILQKYIFLREEEEK